MVETIFACPELASAVAVDSRALSGWDDSVAAVVSGPLAQG